MNSIPKFIDLINSSGPDISNILRKRIQVNLPLSYDAGIKYLNENNRLSFKDPDHHFEDPIEDLVYNTNINFLAFSGIVFRGKIRIIPPGYRCFAKWNDDNNICMNNLGYILSFQDGYNKDIQHIANNFYDFLDLCYAGWRYDNCLIYNLPFPEEKELAEKLIEKRVNKVWVNKIFNYKC